MAKQTITRIIHVGGRDLPLGPFNVAEWREIQRSTGLRMTNFEQEVIDGNADALTALIVLHRRRAGDKVRFEDVADDTDDFSFRAIVEDGRSIEFVTEPVYDENGDVINHKVKTVNGEPVVLLDGVEHVGLPDRVDPTVAPTRSSAEETSTQNSHGTPPTSGASSEFVPGIPATLSN